MDKIRKQTILVPITFEGKQTVLRLNDIDSLLSEGHYLIINCHHEAYRVRGSFKTFFEKYPNDDFCSNMKGQYVNMRYIKYIDTGRIVLKDGNNKRKNNFFPFSPRTLSMAALVGSVGAPPCRAALPDR